MGCDQSERAPLTSAVIQIDSYESRSPSPQPANKRMWLTGRRGLSAACLCLLILSILAAIAASQRGKFVNCKKMVFAPICRGVAAKRSGNPLNSLHYKAQPRLVYSMRGSSQYLPSAEKQSPYWFYQARLADRTYP